MLVVLSAVVCYRLQRERQTVESKATLFDIDAFDEKLTQMIYHRGQGKEARRLILTRLTELERVKEKPRIGGAEDASTVVRRRLCGKYLSSLSAEVLARGALFELPSAELAEGARMCQIFTQNAKSARGKDAASAEKELGDWSLLCLKDYREGENHYRKALEMIGKLGPSDDGEGIINSIKERSPVIQVLKVQEKSPDKGLWEI